MGSDQEFFRSLVNDLSLELNILSSELRLGEKAINDALFLVPSGTHLENHADIQLLDKSIQSLDALYAICSALSKTKLDRKSFACLVEEIPLGEMRERFRQDAPQVMSERKSNSGEIEMF